MVCLGESVNYSDCTISNLSSCLSFFMPSPENSKLWYDNRDVSLD